MMMTVKGFMMQETKMKRKKKHHKHPVRKPERLK